MKIFSRFSKSKTSPKPAEWACPACTYHNTKGTKCEMCQTNRPPPSKRSPKISLQCRTPSGKVVDLTLDISTTTGYLKDVLESKTGIPSAQQRLFVGSNKTELLDDSQKIEFAIPVKEGSKAVIVTIEEKGDKKKKSKEPEIVQKTEVVDTPPEIEPISAIPDEWGSGQDETAPASVIGDVPDEGEWDAIESTGDGDGWEDTKFLGQNELAESQEAKAKVQDIRETGYAVLSEEKVFAEQKEFLDQIDDVLGVTLSEAALLLRHYRWKKDKLLEDWCKDSEKVRKAAGLRAVVKSEDLRGEFDCPFCLTTYDLSETLALACGHRFCKTCWTSWLNAEMEKGPQAVFTTCPSFKCGEVVPDDIFLSLLSDEKKTRLRNWLTRNFIEGSEVLKWCPGKDCNRAVKYDAGGQKDIECECGHRFCFKCADEAHQPCPCHLMSSWIQKNKSDKENTDWILANTKMCPKCKVHIEKNQGCNHMTCRNCKYEFCWLCKGDWKSHGSNTGGFYTCNTFETQKLKGVVSAEDLKAQEAQNNLNKYIFYYKRFTTHDKAVEFAQKTHMNLEGKVRHTDLKRADFLLQATQTVIQCRRGLKWSYVLGYYLKDGSRAKKIFEDDQGHLEELADRLHGLVEKLVLSDDIEKAREEIERQREETLGVTRATKTFQQNLSDGIMGGRYEAGLTA